MKYLLLNILFFFCVILAAQNTVGVLSYNKELSDPGYNMFFSHNQSNVYLVDACGEIVHLWEDDEDFRPGNSVYLLPNSNLVKCKRGKNSIANAPIWAGGGGETVEILSWENELISSYTLNDSLYRLHHDIAPLPNGNVLMIAWNAKTKEEAISAGRVSGLIGDQLWSLAILEWDPVIDKIVWEWNAWDHLIQDIESENDNYGNVSDNPNKIDINYFIGGFPDWLHTNAIDYNPVLDQIVVSVPHFDELWIIDHSTTSEESASSSGGNSGKGGDLLYRWGNPKTYDQGDSTDQQFFFQHDVHWINPFSQEGDSDYGKIILFNNRVPGPISTINILQTAVEGFNYSLSNSGEFLPSHFEETFIHPDSIQIAFSGSVSSADLLPNNNILAFSGRWGYAYEITPNNEIVWEYRVPILNGDIAPQGTNLGIGDNLTFRLKRYPLNFPAFIGKNLEPIMYLETMPDVLFCDQLVSVPNIPSQVDRLSFFPNPVDDFLTIELTEESNVQFSIFDVDGRIRKTGKIRLENKRIDISDFRSGIYFLKVNDYGFYKIIKN